MTLDSAKVNKPHRCTSRSCPRQDSLCPARARSCSPVWDMKQILLEVHVTGYPQSRNNNKKVLNHALEQYFLHICRLVTSNK